MRITIKGKKEAGTKALKCRVSSDVIVDFTISQARLLMEGKELWNVLDSLLGPVIATTFRYSLYPISLTPNYSMSRILLYLHTHIFCLLFHRTKFSYFCSIFYKQFKLWHSFCDCLSWLNFRCQQSSHS